MLRPGRRVDINYDWASVPISVTVIGEIVNIMTPPLIIDGHGELTPGPLGLRPIVQFYSDLGWRTVCIDEITVR